MRLGSALLGLLSTQVLAAVVNTNGRPFTEQEMAELLLKSPHIMPKKTYQTISRILNHLTKRQDQNQKSTGSQWDRLMDNLNALGTIPALLTTGSTAPVTETAPKSLVPEIQKWQSPDYSYATRVKVRYGPFRMPATSEKNLDWYLWNMEGGSSNLKFGITKPCDECSILRIESAIEYADGSPATMKTEALFHHTILFNAGPNVREATCRQPFMENIFMSGNEETPANFTVLGSKIKAGYKVHSSDSFIMTTDLQNFAPKEQYVWQTITYDIVNGPAPEVLSSQTVWFTIGTVENPSIGLCHYSNGEFPWGPTNLTSKDLPKSKVFSEHSKVWRAESPAMVLLAGGHVHAGATNIEIFKNGKIFCNSIATYGKSNSEGGHSHGGGMAGMKRQIKGGNYTNNDVEFIKGMSFCNFPEGVQLRTNDALYIQANYDLNLHKGVLNANGDLDQVMGMAGVLVAFYNNSTSTSN